MNKLKTNKSMCVGFLFFFLDISEKWLSGQISTLRSGETGKSRKLLPKSAYLEQKLLEPQTSRNLYVMIFDNLLFKD